MSKHTPGSWTHEGQGDITGIEDNGFGRGPVDVCSVYLRTVEGRHEANARLIAAAPDLLEALEHMLNVCPAIDSSGEDARGKALAIVARAKGETVSAKESTTPAHDCWFCDGTKEYQGEPCLICVEQKS